MASKAGRPRGVRPSAMPRVAPAGAAIVVVALLAGGAAWWRSNARVSADPRAAVTLHSNPAGAEVFIGGAAQGRTPLTLHVDRGSYDIRLTDGDRSRTIRVEAQPGAALVHHVDLPAAAAPAAATGTLEVQTDPERMAITVGGVARGSSPLKLDSLPPGELEIVARGARSVIRRVVKIVPGQTASLLFSASAEPSALLAGWLSVASPIPMQLRENGRLIGTTETESIMLPSGSHEIEVVEPALGYRAVHKVSVTAGSTAKIKVELPNGRINLNAQPWADVWIDGQRVGETPLANVTRRIGRHEIVFRHPQLGERRETVVLTAGTPLKLGVDMRKD